MDNLKEIQDLIDEVGDKNHLLVTVHRGKKVNNRLRLDRGTALESSSVPTIPGLHLYDRLRMLKGKKPICLKEAFRRFDGDLVGAFPNLRTTVGIDYVSAQLGGSASTTVAKYIALSNNTNAASAANTSSNTTNTRICWGTANATDAAASTSRGEYTALGLARAAATYAHTTSNTFYTQTLTDTASSTITAVQAAGLLDNASQGSGTLYLESVFTPTSMVNTDQITIAWTVNI